jgi:hypothetical protein
VARFLPTGFAKRELFEVVEVRYSEPNMKNIFSPLNIIIAISAVSAVLILNQFIYLLPIHIGSFVITITAVVIADLYALLWVIGKLSTLRSWCVTGLHYVVGTGLLVSITSGFVMFLPLREYLVTVEAFWVKVAFVIVLIINSFVIGQHMHIPTSQTFSSLTKKDRRPLIVSGAVSAISWITVFVSALMLNV